MMIMHIIDTVLDILSFQLWLTLGFRNSLP